MPEKSLAEVADTIRANVGVAADFDFEVVALPEAGAEIRLPFAEKMLRLGGTVSGPVLMTLVDTVMYAAIIGHTPAGEFGVTSHLNVEFLRRPAPETLLAHAHLVRVGHRQAVGTVTITGASDERLLVHATVTYALFSEARQV